MNSPRRFHHSLIALLLGVFSFCLTTLPMAAQTLPTETEPAAAPRPRPGDQPCEPAGTPAFAFVKVGTGFRAFTTGDFNQDGFLDLAAIGGPPVRQDNSSNIAIFLQIPFGGFTAPKAYPAGIGSVGLVAGDFNHDTIPDLALSNSISKDVSILLGNGDGSFRSPSRVPVTENPGPLTTADFNGDGHLDLAVAHRNAGTVAVLLGFGNGLFQPLRAIPVGKFPNSLATADFDRDGRLDLAVANSNSADAVVLFGNGGGTFGRQLRLGGGGDESWFSVTADDLNQDRIPDLVVTTGANTILTYLNSGTGTFSPREFDSFGKFPLGIAIGDLNADGKPDLVATNRVSNAATLFRGDGRGNFAATRILAAGLGPLAVLIRDFNRDGRPDLLVQSGSSEGITILFNRCDEPW